MSIKSGGKTYQSRHLLEAGDVAPVPGILDALLHALRLAAIERPRGLTRANVPAWGRIVSGKPQRAGGLFFGPARKGREGEERCIQPSFRAKLQMQQTGPGPEQRKLGATTHDPSQVRANSTRNSSKGGVIGAYMQGTCFVPREKTNSRQREKEKKAEPNYI